MPGTENISFHERLAEVKSLLTFSQPFAVPRINEILRQIMRSRKMVIMQTNLFLFFGRAPDYNYKKNYLDKLKSYEQHKQLTRVQP